MLTGIQGRHITQEILIFLVYGADVCNLLRSIFQLENLISQQLKEKLPYLSPFCLKQLGYLQDLLCDFSFLWVIFYFQKSYFKDVYFLL